MKKKLKAISSELKKASKTHAGQAAKIDKLIKPKMSKLHKSKRRMARPMMSMKPMMSMSKPKKAVDPSLAKGGGKFSKAGGIIGAVGDVIGLGLSIAGGLKKDKKAKPKVAAEPVAGRVQKPYLSTKKVARKKKAIDRKQSKIASMKKERLGLAKELMNKYGKDGYNKIKANSKEGRKFTGSLPEGDKRKIRQINNLYSYEKQKGKAVKRKMSKINKPKLFKGGARSQKGINVSVGGRLANIAALGGLAYLFFGNKKKKK